jgi:molybdenum cofactor cytidylyltransferase
MSPPEGRARVGGLVLAAGAARRFGSPKQLAMLDGRPLLEHALAAMAAATGVQEVVVVLGSHAEQILAKVQLHGARVQICADWQEGQAASLRTGVAALSELADAVVITLGDQPAIDPRAIDLLVSARNDRVLAARAGYRGRPGHPVLLEQPLFDAVAQLQGDEGARRLLVGVAVTLVECDGLGSDADIDTVEGLHLSEGGSCSPS